MAFRSGSNVKRSSSKEVKKSSYYVWFLGARESRGLRGNAALRPALRHLLEREREVEPVKVTLQVSSKGLKMVQPGNGIHVIGNGAPSLRPDLLNTFIPHDAITCVSQEEPPDDDLVACILLLYNATTRCPVHVHAFRCDSVETATLLRRQLEALADRPEQQRRLAELEGRLASPPVATLASRQLSSDGRSTRGDSESSGSERDAPAAAMDERTANLYASLTAELREKLGSRARVPILLPPRDYDTVHRSQGKLVGIDNRRSLQLNVVGPHSLFNRQPATRLRSHEAVVNGGTGDSSGQSSGIGSDEAPCGSPPRGAAPTRGRQMSGNAPDAASSSDEEWEAQRQMQQRAAHEYIRWDSRCISPPPKTEDIRRCVSPPRNERRSPREWSPLQQRITESTAPNIASRDFRSPPPSNHPIGSPPSTQPASAREWGMNSLPRDANAYPRVLPRVRPRSPPQSHRYQELPNEKRYPGLDRDSARVHYLGPSQKDGGPPAEPRSPPVPDLRRRSTYMETPQDERRFSYADASGYRFIYPGRRRVGMAAQQY